MASILTFLYMPLHINIVPFAVCFYIFMQLYVTLSIHSSQSGINTPDIPVQCWCEVMHMQRSTLPCGLGTTPCKVFTPFGVSMKASPAVKLELVVPINYLNHRPEEAQDELYQIHGSPIQ
jgi:hypothetical protein